MSQTRTECARFEQILSAEDEGHELPQDDQIFTRAHAAACADCATLLAASDVLADPQAAEPALQDELARRRWLDQLVEREALGEPVLPVRASRRSAVIAVTAAAIAAAGLAVALWALDDGGQPHPALVADVEPARTGPQVIAATADARVLHTRLQPGDTLLQGQTLSAGTGTVIARISPAVTVELDSGGELRLAAVNTPDLNLWIERGRLRSIVAPLQPGQRYVVATRHGEVEAHGTAFEVQVDQQGASVQVTEGSVWVREKGRDQRTLSAGDRAVMGRVPDSAATATLAAPDRHKLVASAGGPAAPDAAPDAEHSPTPDPKALLDSAREALLPRRWHDAAADYRRLVAEFPEYAEADTARVALGELLIDRLGDAAGALQSFEAYLAHHPDGTLALEAGFGKARALRATGQTELERKALEAFLARFPEAVQAGPARQRLLELGRSR